MKSAINLNTCNYSIILNFIFQGLIKRLVKIFQRHVMGTLSWLQTCTWTVVDPLPHPQQIRVGHQPNRASHSPEIQKHPHQHLQTQSKYLANFYILRKTTITGFFKTVQDPQYLAHLFQGTLRQKQKNCNQCTCLSIICNHSSTLNIRLDND